MELQYSAFWFSLSLENTQFPRLNTYMVSSRGTRSLPVIKLLICIFNIQVLVSSVNEQLPTSFGPKTAGDVCVPSHSITIRLGASIRGRCDEYWWYTCVCPTRRWVELALTAWMDKWRCSRAKHALLRHFQAVTCRWISANSQSNCWNTDEELWPS